MKPVIDRGHSFLAAKQARSCYLDALNALTSQVITFVWGPFCSPFMIDNTKIQPKDPVATLNLDDKLARPHGRE